MQKILPGEFNLSRYIPRLADCWQHAPRLSSGKPPVFNSFDYGPSYGQIANANSKATSAENKARAAEFDVRRLVDRLDSLALTCQAMWELLREKTDLTDEDLRQRMQEVDLRDGTADGRLKPVAVDCKECGRPVNSRRGTCLYCGREMQSEHVFDQ